MSVQNCPIKIPDDYEFDRYGFAKIGETCLNDVGETFEAVSGVNLFVIVKRKWAWPYWLKAKYIAMNDGGNWNAFKTQPCRNITKGYWFVGDSDDSIDLSGWCHNFAGPPCNNWTESLRKNPKAE